MRILVVCLLLVGCANPNPPAPKAPSAPNELVVERVEVHQWKVTHETPYNEPGDLHKSWVCLATGRTDDIEILHANGEPFNVFVRGAGYGSFETLDEAEMQGLKVYRLRGLTCPE